MAEVCSLRSKQWRKIEDFEYGVPVPDPRSGSGKLVAGCVHWPYLADYTPHRRDYGSEDFILSLDLSTETDNKVMLPCSRREIFCWRLCAVNDCLCVSVVNKDHSIALWMMKDYGVSGSWTKLFSCHGAPGLDPPLYVLDNHRVLYQGASGILMFNNGSSRLATSGSESSSKTEEIHVYMETLVCPATEY
ncbi:F-box/kelch-repeat protein At3g23880 [Linum grandiflorum]